MWNVDGGFEIYNNEFWGGDTQIDVAGHLTVREVMPIHGIFTIIYLPVPL